MTNKAKPISHRPSQTDSEYWLFAVAPDQRTLDLDTCGKWQLFVPRDHVDEAWDTVADLVHTGRLGPSAKVSSTKPNPNSPDGPGLHVIIVYAPDWRDVVEVRRILKVLRNAGLAKGWVHFKRDIETYAGAYVVTGRRGVSVWNARPGDGDEISTTWVTGKPIQVTPENGVEIVSAIERLEASQSQHPAMSVAPRKEAP